MRAGRVISMLFALQQHHRMTAAELAAQLEVSVRTVLRDVETLSGAGVPIFTVQGAGGGIELMDSFRSALTDITADEAEALFLAGQPGVAGALGLAPAALAARHKLLQALIPTLREAAAGLDDWFLHDPLGRNPTVGADLLRLTSHAIRARVELRLPGWEVIRPLGLVLEAGAWQLVHLGAGGPQVRPLSDLIPAESLVLGRSFVRPADFDLTAVWSSLAPT